MKNEIYNANCLEKFRDLADGSIDCIVTDPPYVCTDCKWDIPFDLNQFWSETKRVLKPSGVVVIFGNFRLGAALYASNPKWFRYEWIWKKNRGVNFAIANKQPLRNHEFVFVFAKGLTTYNKQYWYSTPYRIKARKRNHPIACRSGSSADLFPKETDASDGRRFPLSVLEFYQNFGKRLHPTQKPDALCEYLVKTYTNPGETVLDPFMGSGSTGAAALKLGRRFIGIELDERYFEIAKQRLEEAAELPPDP